jgi:hypothetical protein
MVLSHYIVSDFRARRARKSEFGPMNTIGLPDEEKPEELFDPAPITPQK